MNRRAVMPATRADRSRWHLNRYVRYYGPAIPQHWPLVFDTPGRRPAQEWAAYDPGHSNATWYNRTGQGPLNEIVGTDLNPWATADLEAYRTLYRKLNQVPWRPPPSLPEGSPSPHRAAGMLGRGGLNVNVVAFTFAAWHAHLVGTRESVSAAGAGPPQPFQEEDRHDGICSDRVNRPECRVEGSRGTPPGGG